MNQPIFGVKFIYISSGNHTTSPETTTRGWTCFRPACDTQKFRKDQYFGEADPGTAAQEKAFGGVSVPGGTEVWQTNKAREIIKVHVLILEFRSIGIQKMKSAALGSFDQEDLQGLSVAQQWHCRECS